MHRFLNHSSGKGRVSLRTLGTRYAQCRRAFGRRIHLYRRHIDNCSSVSELPCSPNDPAGTLSLSHFYVTPSGNAYAYNAECVLSALYVYSQR
jgi:hypothetical protein